MQLRVTIAPLVIFAMAFLANCGGATPTVSQARSAFEEQHKAELQKGIMKINSFSKVDGQSGEFMGIKLYELKYEAEVEYPEGQHPQCRNPNNPGCGILFSFKDIGEKEVLKGEIQFEQTERGWQVRRR